MNRQVSRRFIIANVNVLWLVSLVQSSSLSKSAKCWNVGCHSFRQNLQSKYVRCVYVTTLMYKGTLLFDSFFDVTVFMRNLSNYFFFKQNIQSINILFQKAVTNANCLIFMSRTFGLPCIFKNIAFNISNFITTSKQYNLKTLMNKTDSLNG